MYKVPTKLVIYHLTYFLPVRMLEIGVTYLRFSLVRFVSLVFYVRTARKELTSSSVKLISNFYCWDLLISRFEPAMVWVDYIMIGYGSLIFIVHTFPFQSVWKYGKAIGKITHVQYFLSTKVYARTGITKRPLFNGLKRNMKDGKFINWCRVLFWRHKRNDIHISL